MEISNIPEAFTASLRLKLISALIGGEKTFSELKKITSATDGNISVQLSKLEKWEMVTSAKTIAGRRTKTKYMLTNHGRKEFEEYVLLLESIIKQDEN